MTTHPCTNVSVVVRDMVHEKRPTRANTVTTACSCAAPATTSAPHSPGSVGPGQDASSVSLVVAPVPFVSAPTVTLNPKRPPPSTRKLLSVTAQPPRTRMPSHNPRLAPTLPALSPLLRRRASTPRHHTRPHTLSSLTGTHTPPPAAAPTAAHRSTSSNGSSRV